MNHHETPVAETATRSDRPAGTVRTVRPGDSGSGRIYRGVARSDRDAERRARLVAAGLELFGTQGFSATTVKAICAEARLTERYFYESFENREALFEAVGLKCVTGLMNELVTAAGRIGDDRNQHARAMLLAFFRWFQADPRRTRIQLHEPLVMGERFHTLYRDVTALFADLVRSASMHWYENAARKRRLDLDLMSKALVGAAVTIVRTWHDEGYRRPIEDLVHSTAFLFQSLGESLEEASPGRATTRRSSGRPKRS